MKLNFSSNAMKTLRTYNKNIIEHSRSIKNISSGKKISSSKDNPNRVSKLGNIEKEIRGHQASRKNIQDTISMIQSADGVMDTVGERISRIRELAVSIGNGTVKDEEKNIMQNEVNKLLDGIDYEVKNFSFNNLNIIGSEKVNDNSNPNIIKTLSGGESGDFTDIPIYNLSKDGLGLDGLDLTKENISSILDKLDNASSQVIGARTKLGTINNTLEEKIENSQSLEDVLSNSKSKIEDADVALEMVEFSRTLMLTEANIKNMSKTIYFPNDMINVLGKLYK